MRSRRSSVIRRRPSSGNGAAHSSFFLSFSFSSAILRRSRSRHASRWQRYGGPLPVGRVTLYRAAEGPRDRAPRAPCLMLCVGLGPFGSRSLPRKSLPKLLRDAGTSSLNASTQPNEQDSNHSPRRDRSLRAPGPRFCPESVCNRSMLGSGQVEIVQAHSAGLLDNEIPGIATD